jgi:hypothetical protein
MVFKRNGIMHVHQVFVCNAVSFILFPSFHCVVLSIHYLLFLYNLFGIAHNRFMSCCELFFYQTLIFKIFLWVKLFFSSHRDMSWDKAEKSSLS